MKRIFINILLLVFTASTTFSQTTISGGIVNGKWTKTNSPYNVTGSIQIINGDSLIIEPGVTVCFQGTYKLLVLGKLIAIGTPSDTIIFTAANTSNGWRGIRFDNTPSSNDTSRIKYSKIEYGNASGFVTPEQSGGGIYFYNFSKAVVSFSSIVNCKADKGGGGIYISNASIKISDNFIAQNKVANYGSGGGIVSIGNSIICNNVISDNYSEKDGGGIYISGNASVYNNNIKNNNSGQGGGVFINGGNSIITGNNITNNRSGSGGGLSIGYGRCKITYNNITFNTSNYGGGIESRLTNSTDSLYIGNNNINNNLSNGSGGGIYSLGSTCVSNNIISYNTSSGYQAGGIFCRGYNYFIINNNIISNNKVSSSAYPTTSGGGIQCEGNSNVIKVNNNLIINNSASFGGGIYCINGSPTLINNTIANNNASISGGALYCASSSPSFSNCIFWGNTAAKSGAQAFLYDEISDPNFYNCDVEGGSNKFELNGNFYTGTYLNNIDKKPLFLDPSNGSGESYDGVSANWTLDSQSPCRDAGNLSGSYPSTDIAGNKRIANRIIDMGAYEFPVILTDAGLELILPINSSYCGKIKLPITVQLFNFGDDILKSTNIIWKLNGVVKKSLTWSGLILPSKDSIFTIDSVLFDSAKNYEVSIYNSKPNSIADTFNTNDTATALIKVYPIPDASFSHTVIHDTVAFTRHNTSSASSTWQFGDGSSSTQNNPSHIYTHARTYTVTHTITSVNGCVATYQESFNVMVAGIKSFSKSVKLSVYPNPVNSTTTVQYTLAKPCAVNISIYDLSGKSIYASDLGLMSSGNHSSQLDVSGFPVGIYLLKIEADNVSMYSRIVKE